MHDEQSEAEAQTSSNGGAGEEKESVLAIEAQHLTLATGLSQRETVAGPWKLWVGADGEDDAVTMTVVA